MIVENIYTSSACNQVPTILDWGQNGLICYGACNSVLIYDPKHNVGGKITHSLIKHTKRVNAVCWVKGIDYETECVSVSADGSVIVWTLIESEYVPQVLNGHNSVVNTVCALYRDASEHSLVVFSAADDSTVKIWIRSSLTEEFSESYNINLGYDICLSINATFFPESEIIILACALNDSKIHLYCEEGEPDLLKPLTFRKQHALRGHEDWVRGLDFKVDVNGDVILASSSQDAFIRLWRISSLRNCNSNVDVGDDNALKIGHDLLATDVGNFSVVIESVLTGHEGWIYSVCWSPVNMKLLSASIDKSMIIWEFNKELGIWMDDVRVGEVGGNTLGFYGGKFGPTGNEILGHGYLGSLHMWHLGENNSWSSSVTVGGHFNEVIGVEWEPKGNFLISISEDETTRIHAPWVQFDNSLVPSWHEIARPQIHGYSLSCLAILSRYSFVSGADEKVIRVFKAPRNFIDNFRRICKAFDEDPEGDDIIDSSESGPQGASVPSLGLSNKAIFENDNLSEMTSTDKNSFPVESYFTATELEDPPTEETLLQNTLWPEIQKLYGHGYELFALATSPDGKILASACKATTAAHAAIILWDTSTWEQVQKLNSHTLTVAQLSFSPDSNHLLSVSRDRRWSVFTKRAQSENNETDNTALFSLAATTDKKNGIHTRIIWTCSWSYDSKFFATGSRDGKTVVWTRDDSIQETTSSLGKYRAASSALELGAQASVTALAFSPVSLKKDPEDYLLAIGLELGAILIYWWNTERGFEPVYTMDRRMAHHLTVKKLSFRPILGQAGVSEECTDRSTIQLASCSSDHSVKVFNLHL